MLYVLEHGLHCEIRPVFDPKISPRNHIIIGRRITQYNLNHTREQTSVVCITVRVLQEATGCTTDI
ncbi:hypothetical protein RR48_03595 [Papilio machaon]|uniref:Uncharacterized protein n=1 Tax=Papilio machaon TaxID=76193 RepID=A0A0N1IP18_PAPMA|nr:hypothetical protein RR48_03595 [Papilio machaon]